MCLESPGTGRPRGKSGGVWCLGFSATRASLTSSFLCVAGGQSVSNYPFLWRSRQDTNVTRAQSISTFCAMDARNPGEIMDAVAQDARESRRQEPLYGGFTRFELEVEVSVCFSIIQQELRCHAVRPVLVSARRMPSKPWDATNLRSRGNPWYLNHLATQKLFDNPAFVAYLSYLQYFSQPEYAKYLL